MTGSRRRELCNACGVRIVVLFFSQGAPLARRPWATVWNRVAVRERTTIERRIEAVEREIDRLVYELYGLTAEEIRLVEEATAK